jgi:hypothetical protein
MGDKLALFSEKKYTYSGYFDMKAIYNYIKDYLEESRHYDISEKDYSESHDGNKREITSVNEAEQQWNDVFKVILKYQLNMSGVDEEVEINEKKKVILTKGKATIIINAYIEMDTSSIPQKGPFSTFLNKVYNHFFRKSELDEVKKSAMEDVNGLLYRFKTEINSKLK